VKFWNFFESLGTIPADVTTDKAILDHSLSVVESNRILSLKSEYALLRTALSLHHYNPAVEMHNQLSKSELLLSAGDVNQIKKVFVF
jgi:hypothetical protein